MRNCHSQSRFLPLTVVCGWVAISACASTDVGGETAGVGGPDAELSQGKLTSQNGIVFGNGVNVPNSVNLPNGISLANSIVLPNGISLSNGITLNNGLVLPNGVLLNNGVPLPNGVELINGAVLGNGAVLNNGAIFPNGGVLPNGTTLTQGATLPNGGVMPNGIVLGNGAVIPNGTPLPNGAIFGNGAIIGNGVKFANGAILPNGTLLNNGSIIPNGTLLGNGAIFPNGATLYNAVTLPNGGVLPNGAQLNNGVLFLNGVVLNNGAQLNNGAILPNGGRMSNGATIANGTALPNGTVLGNGTILGKGANLGKGAVFPYGLSLPPGTVLPTGTVLPKGTILLNGTSVPTGTVLGSGTILPNGTNTSACPSGICNNGINISQGLMAPVSGSGMYTFLQDPAKYKIIKYLLQCAMTPSQSVTVAPAGTLASEVVTGAVGLAPNYRTTGMLDTADQEWVSACLLARVNQQGKTVIVDMVSKGHPSLNGNTPGYTYLEGHVWGNIFTNPPRMFARSSTHGPATRYCSTSTSCAPFITTMYCYGDDGQPEFNDAESGSSFAQRCPKGDVQTPYETSGTARVIAMYLPTGSCTPMICASAGQLCGTIPDRCGGTLNCGNCACGTTHTCGPSTVTVNTPIGSGTVVQLWKGSTLLNPSYSTYSATVTQGDVVTARGVWVDPVTGTAYPRSGQWDGACSGVTGSSCSATISPGFLNYTIGTFSGAGQGTGAPPESDAQYCARVGLNCGSLSYRTDRSGLNRQINCGACGAGFTCGRLIPNVCGANALPAGSRLTIPASLVRSVDAANPTAVNVPTPYTVKSAGGTNQEVYLSFTVAGMGSRTARARVLLGHHNMIVPGNYPQLYRVASGVSPSTVWNNKPLTSGSAILPTRNEYFPGDYNADGSRYFEYDVTPLITGDGTYQFALKGVANAAGNTLSPNYKLVVDHYTDSPEVVLFTPTNHIVCDQPNLNELAANCTKVSAADTLRIIPVAGPYGNEVALLSANGKYVTASFGGGSTLVNNYATTVGAWETFRRFSAGDGQIYLTTSTGHFVTAEGGGGYNLVADRTTVGAWELFREVTVKNYALKTDTGHYLSAESGGGYNIVANRTSVGAWETFRVLTFPNGTAVLQVNGGQYVTATPEMAWADRTAVGPWEFFTLQPVVGGMGLKAYNSLFLSAAGGGGGAVTVDRPVHGVWETFQLIPR